MEISDEQRQALAALVRQRRGVRFNTKLAAYQAAGLNPTTWDRIEAGQRVRDDRLRAAVRALWPETGGDWTQVDPAAPPEEAPRGVEQWLAELEGRVAAIERHLHLEAGEGRGHQSAATSGAGSRPAVDVAERPVVLEDVSSPGELLEEPATQAQRASGRQDPAAPEGPALS